MNNWDIVDYIHLKKTFYYYIIPKWRMIESMRIIAKNEDQIRNCEILKERVCKKLKR